MSAPRISIAFLADHPDAVPVVSKWLIDEWGERGSTTAVARFVECLRPQLNRDRIPAQFIALIDQQVAGIAMLKKHELLAVHPELVNWLGSVFVAPEFRGQGIATALCRHAVDVARSLGISTLHLQTADLSGGLYARLGFQPSHQIDHAGLVRLVMKLQCDTIG